MTPSETHLVDAMASALSKSAPDVASNLDGPDPQNLRSRVRISDTAVAVFYPSVELIVLESGNGTVVLTPEAFQALERFAEQIGWRPQ